MAEETQEQQNALKIQRGPSSRNGETREGFMEVVFVLVVKDGVLESRCWEGCFLSGGPGDQSHSSGLVPCGGRTGVPDACRLTAGDLSLLLEATTFPPASHVALFSVGGESLLGFESLFFSYVSSDPSWRKFSALKGSRDHIGPTWRV